MRDFHAEWRLARPDPAAALACIAIVDEVPASQYLYPEFLLLQRLFAAHGLRAVVVDARELVCRDGVLRAGADRIDLVYNRLTDFYFEAPGHVALRAAYLADAVVVTPHPRVHALYANKRNLTLWTDCARLETWGIAAATVQTLFTGIPATRRVDSGAAESLWADRARWFFKPAQGFGSRGSFRN